MRLTITTYNVLDMLQNWQFARPFNFLFLPMVDPTFGYSFYRRSDEKVLLVAPFSSKQDSWFNSQCINIYDGKRYKMVDYKQKITGHNVVLPSQFERLVVEYHEHPEAKSLGPDGRPCQPNTKGLLQRTHVVAGDIRYVGKETDRKWEEGEDLSVLEFRANEYGRSRSVIADHAFAAKIREVGIRETMRLTGMSQHTIEKIANRERVKRSTHKVVLDAIASIRKKPIN